MLAWYRLSLGLTLPTIAAAFLSPSPYLRFALVPVVALTALLSARESDKVESVILRDDWSAWVK